MLYFGFRKSGFPGLKWLRLEIAMLFPTRGAQMRRALLSLLTAAVIAAVAGPAAVGAASAAVVKIPPRPRVALSEAERTWLERSNRKVTVKVGSEDQLMAVYEQALRAGLVAHLITDGGLTEFGGVPTRTCLGIGPDYDDRIDPVTGDLELY
jgi:peptidyl-tRNA hydrolase